MEKIKNHKIALFVTIGVVGFVLFNFCWWAGAWANNVSNDGNRYYGDLQNIRCDTMGFNHGRCYIWHRIDGPLGKRGTWDIEIGNTIEDYKGGIKGSDLKGDFVADNEYEIDDCFLSVNGNTVTLHYRTYTDDFDWDGEDFEFIFVDPKLEVQDSSTCWYIKWRDRSDNLHKMDEESMLFTNEELNKFFDIPLDKNGEAVKTLEQAIRDGEASIVCENIFMDDFLGEHT